MHGNAQTVETLIGLKQTAPAYGRFEVKPRLGGMKRASVKVPTPHGPIWVNATADFVCGRRPVGFPILNGAIETIILPRQARDKHRLGKTDQN
jgi:hypothetical protein